MFEGVRSLWVGLSRKPGNRVSLLLLSIGNSMRKRKFIWSWVVGVKIGTRTINFDINLERAVSEQLLATEAQ